MSLGMRRSGWGWIVVSAVSALTLARGLEAGDFPVSTGTGSVFDRVAIDKGPAGDFVTAYFQIPGIFVRSFGSDGLPSGPATLINDPYLAIDVGGVSVARFADGSAIAAWATEVEVIFAEGGILPGIFYCKVEYRLVDASGQPTGPPVGIGSLNGGMSFGGCDRGSTGAAVQPDGSAVVVFQHYSPYDAGGRLVEAVRIPNQGNLPPTLSAEFALNPAIATGPAGELAAGWILGPTPSISLIMLRLFAPDGTPLGPEFQINDISGPGGPMLGPDIAPRSGGGWLAVWTSVGSHEDDDSGTSIQARLFGADGTFLGPQFQVNTLISGDQSAPHVVALPDGSFLVTWQSPVSYGTDNQGTSIQARHLLADGTPDGPEYQVNSLETGDQLAPDVAAGASGAPTFLWMSQGTEVRASDDRTDLGVTVSDGAASAPPGATLHYLVGVTDSGPADAPAATVAVPFPASLSCTWTCGAIGGASCAPGPVAGDIADVANVPTGGVATYDATCVVAGSATGTLQVTATVTAPGGLTDTNPANNSATDDTDVLNLAIDDVAVDEGNAGTTTASLSVRLLAPSVAPVTVDFGTGDGTATAGSDYVGATGTLSFAPGETVKTVDVSVLGDTVFEADETFFVTLGNATGAGIADGLGVGTVLNDDSGLPSGSLDELVHGSSEVRSLESAPGPAPLAQYWRVQQQPLSSYEVVVDGSSGDLGPQGPALDRVASDGIPVQHATGAGATRSLRWESAGSVSGESIRVQSRGCIDDCDAADVFRVRMWETTEVAARFNNSATQITVLVVQNPGADAVTGNVHFMDVAGALLLSQPFAVGARGTLAMNTSALVPGATGSIRVTSDGSYGMLQGKAVAVEPATGFTFDTPLLPRPR
jgi:Calx-beta domain